jgi:hypothetical protein
MMYNNKHMNLIRENWRRFLVLVYTFFVPFYVVYGAVNPPVSNCEPGKICNPLSGIDSIPGFIQKILEGFISIGIPVIALAIVYSGFLFVFAMGNPEKLKKAKDALLYTLIGGAVLLGSWAIAKMISATITGL